MPRPALPPAAMDSVFAGHSAGAAGEMSLRKQFVPRSVRWDPHEVRKRSRSPTAATNRARQARRHFRPGSQPRSCPWLYTTAFRDSLGNWLELLTATRLESFRPASVHPAEQPMLEGSVA